MKKLFVTLLTLVQITFCIAQNKTQHYDIKAKIIDESTNKALAFVTVFNKQLSTGTASNLDGYFELPNNRVGDSIVVSFIGYETQTIVLTKDTPKEIMLKSHAALIEEVVVVSKSNYLYNIVSKLRKNRKTKQRTSKTYFFLETILYDETVEMIESYYNGEYSNLGIEELNIKKGRIGIKAFDNRYFSSTESSRLFSMFNVFEKNKLYPINPMTLSKKDLMRDYTLKLNYSYHKDQSKVFVIDFEPKNASSKLFHGTVWVDHSHNTLIKVELNIQNSDIHPLLPIVGNNSIKGVDMEITKSYTSMDGEQFIDNIDFNYNVHYVDKLGVELTASTKAFMKAYDYINKFELPLFEFSRHMYEDYRNITVAPYDSYFWKNSAEFRFYEHMKEVEDFINMNKIHQSGKHPSYNRFLLNTQLQFHYLSWNQLRFKMNQASLARIEKSSRTQPFEIDRFNLNVKLYLDINHIQDSLVYQLYTILDPQESFYHFHITDRDLAFMNMYFDLAEIQKRKMEFELSQIEDLSIEILESSYHKHLQAYNKIKKKLVSETERGKNLDRMKDWNDEIIELLKIDNLKYFNLITGN